MAVPVASPHDQSGGLVEIHDMPVLKDGPAGRRARQRTAQPCPVGYGPRTFVTRYETQDPLTYDFRPACAVQVADRANLAFPAVSRCL